MPCSARQARALVPCRLEEGIGRRLCLTAGTGSQLSLYRAKLGEHPPVCSQPERLGAVQPKPDDYSYDLDQALASVVGVKSMVPADAFTAETLGTERAGNGVLIAGGEGLVLTIGYLITEAETVWISRGSGSAVPGHVLGYDQVT